MGPRYKGPTGTSLQLKIERWPGGRWYRDLGDNAGYFWARVQSIKPPTLLEFYGPMFMSSPAISQVQFRLVAEAELVRVSMVHRVLGHIPAVFRDGVHLDERWSAILEAMRTSACSATRCLNFETKRIFDAFVWEAAFTSFERRHLLLGQPRRFYCLYSPSPPSGPSR
jgi:hypothetical protein